MKRFLSFCLMILCCSPSLAAPPFSLPESDAQIPKQVPEYQVAPPFATEGKRSPPVWKVPDLPSESALQQYPQQIEKLLNEALLHRRYEQVSVLLPLYRRWPKADQVLVDFAQGALYRHHSQHKPAIELYRNLIERQPELQTVRLDLAAMLYEDKQIREAAFQFALASQQGLPENVLVRVAQYEQAINHKSRWQWSVYANYVSDDNVNQASAQRELYLPQFPGIPLQKNPEYLPQHAEGLEYGVGLMKDMNLDGNHYLRIGADLNGVSYWNRHDLDEATLKLRAGYGRQTLNSEWFFLPFAEKIRYGNRPYADRYGIDTSTSYWFSPRWRLSGHASWSNKTRVDGIHGREAVGGIGFVYLAGTGIHWLGGLHLSRDRWEHSPGQSRRRSGIYFGREQQWSNGFGNRILLHRSSENYDGRHFVYTDRRRHDRQTNLTLSLWHRRIQVWGIMPKLNWRYSRNRSNIGDLYNYRKQRVFVSLEKAF